MNQVASFSRHRFGTTPEPPETWAKAMLESFEILARAGSLVAARRDA